MSNEFKIKYKGQKLKVRILGMDEVINRKCLASHITTPTDIDWYKEDPKRISNLRLFPTNAVGELVCLHPRIYLEVLSGFYEGEGKTEEEFMNTPLNLL